MNGIIRHNGIPVIFGYSRNSIYYFLGTGKWGLKSTIEHIEHVFNMPKFVLQKEDQPKRILEKISQSMKMTGMSDHGDYSSIYEFLMDIRKHWGLLESMIGESPEREVPLSYIVDAALNVATGILDNQGGLLSLALLEGSSPVIHSSWSKTNLRIGESDVYSRTSRERAIELIEDLDIGNVFSRLQEV